jgi:hypothetical protein
MDQAAIEAAAAQAVVDATAAAALLAAAGPPGGGGPPPFDVAAFTAGMAAALANAFATHQAAHGPVVHPPGAVVYAVAPALARQAVLDYTNDAGAAKIFARATQPLPTTLTKNNPNIKVLLSELQSRSTTFGWDTLFDIPCGGATPVNLLKQHGRMTLGQCKAHALTYMTVEDHTQHNNYQLYLCISDSIDEELKMLMTNDPTSYEVGVVGAEKNCSICFTKSLLSKLEVDTGATAAIYETQGKAADGVP